MEFSRLAPLFGRLSFSCNMSTTTPRRRLNVENINQNIREAKYAVRGELASRSEKYRAKLEEGHKDLPFDQVLSILENPKLLEHEDVLVNQLGYKTDVVDRARRLLKEVGSVGAYSASGGAMGIRRTVAKFIEERDGFPASADTIYLSAGASSAVNTLLHIICATPNSGVLIPIPQYPLYTASLKVLDAQAVPYHLEETKNWSTDLRVIKESHDKAVSEGVDVRAIVIINPGNPTGGSLEREEVAGVIDFAAKHHLVIIADEVYQTNVFKGTFHSFKGVLREMQKAEPGKYDHVELASLHSVSKGMIGECGHRGGYFEVVGFDPLVIEQIYKFISISLCAPVIGQCLVDLMVNPPREGDPSYPLYKEEHDSIFNGLQERALALFEAFKTMEGVECQDPQGSMYLFPTINLPSKAIAAAKEAGLEADEFYAGKLLDATGVCIVPGSGFGQKDGTYHFRTTFLAPGTDWVSRITKFHKEFMNEYR
ncbi:hypothetical protein DH86_00002545 [Scytalidium sp. 3C]|nr:hypothetical protein DH86_00002545 [Scytalidium sp. 3C]